MKIYSILTMIMVVVVFSCKTEEKKETKAAQTEVPEKELSIVEKLAYASGYENWNHIKKLKFTFNVNERPGRTWIWFPKKNEVIAISDNDTLTYNRNDMDSTAYAMNGKFINDKYWLMAPINILWDEQSTTTEHTTNVEAPISKKSMQKLTVTYNQQDGYTPGDAYDFYFDDDFMVKEWVFRRGNQPEPSMITTWEDYTDIGGLKLSQMHKNGDGSFKLFFTDLEVETN
ncbi:hypothetical protein [Pareuzebyella sediminis]|uniref:hypothetical protein n=1 Tax=Pareuzebyella sediminis TaxID=2607998 RepID=UPI0011EBD301|nr:hypothetical protein [Pareuzebyella sediminis]